MEKEINPAINQESTNPILSPEEFQKKLYGWFEDRGLVSEMKTYIRQQLIKMIRTTQVGYLKPPTVTNITIKTQIINILFAEHLLKFKYYYTLSIFTTEIPSSNLLPEFKFLLFPNDEKIKLEESDIYNIIQILGIPTNYNNDIMSVYNEENSLENTSLLSCILNYLTEISKIKDVTVLNVENAEDENIVKFLDYIRKCFAPYNIPSQILTDIETHSKLFLVNLKKSIKAKMEEKLSIVNAKLHENFSKKEAEAAEKFTTTEKKLHEEKKKLENEYKKLKLRIKQVVLKEKDLKNIEVEYKEKLGDINALQKELQSKIRQLQDLSGKNSKESKIIQEPCTLPHCGDSCNHNVEKLHQLKTENIKLKELTEDQRHVVDDLQLKLKLLINQLKQSHNNVNFLNPTLNSDLIKTFQNVNMNFESEDENEDASLSDSPNSSEEVTDHVLQEAKTKLEQLEKESERIELDFLLFKKSGDQ